MKKKSNVQLVLFNTVTFSGKTTHKALIGLNIHRNNANEACVAWPNTEPEWGLALYMHAGTHSKTAAAPLWYTY